MIEQNMNIIKGYGSMTDWTKHRLALLRNERVTRRTLFSLRGVVREMESDRQALAALTAKTQIFFALLRDGR